MLAIRPIVVSVYNQSDLFGFEETASYWSVQLILFFIGQFFSIFLWSPYRLPERTETGLITGANQTVGPCIATITGYLTDYETVANAFFERWMDGCLNYL